ncbi:hypothetical protein [Desulfogranum mediterraneum]|uniref:hypothetical protein n=1 Tax=Desulfogranum mediterraneum TaxID=160661 RepID=UPI00041D5008|nr:hypothetical protein [Desulfogranum mediterraneum]
MHKRFYVSSVGNLYQISLEMFADRLVDQDGREISADAMAIDQTVFAEFQGPTTTTRTSVTRIE